jgi:hypothetical protein
MIQLNLSAEEYDLLKDLLEDCLGDLRMEIGDTDDWNYRTMLRKREAVLQKIYDTLARATTEQEQTPPVAD